MIVSSPAVETLSLSDALALGPSVWDALRAADGTETPFLSWAWHQAWSEAASPALTASSRVLVLRSPAGDINALWPLRLCRTRFRRVPATVLTWAIGDLGCPDHLDVLARSEADVAALIPAIESLPWDVMVLGSVAQRSPNIDHLLTEGERHGWWMRRRRLWRCPYLELPSTWDDYLATLSPTRRQTIRRKERNLSRRYAIQLTTYDGSRLPEGWQRLKALHAQRWDGLGVLETPAMERLHLGFARLLAERGAVWLTTLDLDGVPAAVWYGFAAGNTVSFYQGGWDRQWERHSVASVLMGIMIRRSIEQGYRTFDFLRGDEAYKLSWTNLARTCDEVAVTRDGWRGRALRLLDELAGWRDRFRATSEAVLPMTTEYA